MRKGAPDHFDDEKIRLNPLTCKLTSVIPRSRLIQVFFNMFKEGKTCG